MNLKSYFAATVESAMSTALRELGPEAMLVYSRETPIESREHGRYEVVFGWEGPVTTGAPFGSEERATSPTVVAQSSAGPQLQPTSSRAVQKPSRVAKSKSDGKRVPRDTKPAADENLAVKSPCGWYENALAEEGFSSSLAAWIGSQWEKQKNPASPETGFWEVLSSRIPVSAPDEESRYSALVVAGPGGVGKTTCIEKLAFRIGLAGGRKLHLVSADGGRIGGGSRLGRVADLMGATHSLADSVASLETILRAQSPGRLLLIEGAEWMRASGPAWTALRRRNPGMQVHLMLPVPVRPKDLERMFQQWEIVGPDRLIASRSDESSQVGAVCSLAADRALPLSYITFSALAPRGLEVASVQGLLGPVLAELTQERPATRRTLSTVPESVAVAPARKEGAYAAVGSHSL